MYSESLFRPKSVLLLATFYTYIYRLYPCTSTKPPTYSRNSRYSRYSSTYATDVARSTRPTQPRSSYSTYSICMYISYAYICIKAPFCWRTWPRLINSSTIGFCGRSSSSWAPWRRRRNTLFRKNSARCNSRNGCTSNDSSG